MTECEARTTYNGGYDTLSYDFTKTCAEDLIDGFTRWEVDILYDIRAIYECAVWIGF